MSGVKVPARDYKNKDRSIALFIGIWAHDARQFLTALWVFPSKSSFVTYFGAIACGSRWHARISRQIVTSICDIILWSDTTKRWLFRLECQYTITNYTLFFRFSRCKYYNLKRQFSYNVMLVQFHFNPVFHPENHLNLYMCMIGFVHRLFRTKLGPHCAVLLLMKHKIENGYLTHLSEFLQVSNKLLFMPYNNISQTVLVHKIGLPRNLKYQNKLFFVFQVIFTKFLGYYDQ